MRRVTLSLPLAVMGGAHRVAVAVHQGRGGNLGFHLEALAGIAQRTEHRACRVSGRDAGRKDQSEQPHSVNGQRLAVGLKRQDDIAVAPLTRAAVAPYVLSAALVPRSFCNPAQGFLHGSESSPRSTHHP